ncbi:MAG: hypothetical protein K9M94_00450 [Spirochaetia bacterium]|nr:hypothetical protein [Spirochaetia bacterium]
MNISFHTKVISFPILCALLFFSLAISLPAQTTKQPEEPVDQLDERAEPLPAGFNRIQLGMDLASVQQALEADGNFRYRGEPDVSMLRSRSDSLIQTDGVDFIQQASFQFVDNALFTITLILNPNRLGYYTMYSTLQERYGEPDRLSPDKAVWENEQVQMALERPLRIKYISMPTLQELRRSSSREKSLEKLTRERFLEQF